MCHTCVKEIQVQVLPEQILIKTYLHTCKVFSLQYLEREGQTHSALDFVAGIFALCTCFVMYFPVVSLSP